MISLKTLKYLFIAVGLIYLLFPRDILPDVGLIGRLDDIILLSYLWWQYQRYRNKLSKLGENIKTASSGESSKVRDEAEVEASKTLDPYQVLGVARDASEKDIKVAFRKMAAQYHPDKVEHLAPEFRELAHQRMIDIQHAYDKLVGS